MNDPAITTIDLTSGWVAELARLRRIETAAGEALASGQARYDTLRCPTDPVDGHLLADAAAWVGDLVPAAAMTALRAAVEGEATPKAGQGSDDDQDDDGCPVGDPDCDLPADSLHEFCEAALDGKASPQ